MVLKRSNERQLQHRLHFAFEQRRQHDDVDGLASPSPELMRM